MTLEELNNLLDKSICQVDKCTTINHKPHPYCIGSRHLKHNDSVYLGKEQIIGMEKKHGPMCAMSGCNLKYEDHTSDKVIPFLVYDKDKFQEYINNFDRSIIEEYTEQEKADGFIFVSSKKKE